MRNSPTTRSEQDMKISNTLLSPENRKDERHGRTALTDKTPKKMIKAKYIRICVF